MQPNLCPSFEFETNLKNEIKNKLDVGVESVIFFQIDSAFLKSWKKKFYNFVTRSTTNYLESIVFPVSAGMVLTN
jgi:hypothetical protein